MKHPHRTLIGLLLSIPFLMSLGCPGFQRSPCHYEEKSVKSYISHFEKEQDSIIMVWFKAIDEQESWVWSTNNENKTDVNIHASEFERFDLTIDPETIADTTILYSVEGSFITQGTCGPRTIYSVKKIE